MTFDIDVDNAPTGYIAIKETDGCNGCAFNDTPECNMGKRCCEDERDDHQYVIFKKKEGE